MNTVRIILGAVILAAGAFLLGEWAALGAPKPQRLERIESLQVVVGPGKELYLKISNLAKDDLASVAATFLSKGVPEDKARLDKLFKEAPSVTFVLTSK